MKKTLHYAVIALIGLVNLFIWSSCSNKLSTAPDTKYLSEFHKTYFNNNVIDIVPDQLALYVDYSTCVAEGQHASFFQELVPSWTNSARRYFAIKGEVIDEHSADSTFLLLRNVSEVNYADIKTAAERIAAGDTEGVLITDGEYYQPSIARGNVNNPYLAEAFKTWLKKGRDIYIIAEPFEESNRGNVFHKKRFYFVFTDSRLGGNIYDRIIQTVNLTQYPEVEEFHLSASHPALLTEGGRQSFTPSDLLSARVMPGDGRYEIQDWEVDWKTGIEPMLVNAMDPETGAPLPSGAPFAEGLKVDRNSFGGYRITDIAAKVYNINQEYTDFYNIKDSGEKGSFDIAPQECEYFVKVDPEEWSRRGNISLHFDTEYYNPEPALNGSPFNYFMIQLSVSAVESSFDKYKEMLSFDSIDVPGHQNVSVITSVQQCLTDLEIEAMVKSCPIYTIYIKSNRR